MVPPARALAEFGSALDFAGAARPRATLAHAMSAIRFPLLYAFAGGCLSNALVFGLWRVAEGAGTPQHPAHRSDRVVELAAAATVPRHVEPPRSADAAGVTNADRDVHAAAPEAAPDLDRAESAPVGSAVSEVLMGLEAAYRERMASRAPALAQPSPSAMQARASTAAASDDVTPRELVGSAPAAAAVAAAPIGPTPAVPAPAVPAPVIPAPVAAVTPAPAALAPSPAAPASVAVAPASSAAVAVAPAVAAAPPVAAEDAARPVEVHYGDVNQNTYITNVRQGDVYLIQLQQLAMLQYMQQLALTSGMAAPARHAGGAGAKRATFPSGITNPDNPWGFHFAPPNLVR